jgi:hypothetical protein
MSESGLVQLLSTDTEANRRSVEEWLKKTPPNDAANLLARVLAKHPARSARAETYLYALIFAFLLVMVAALVWKVLREFQGIVPVWAFVFPIVLLSRQGSVGRRAALLLARLDDRRAIPGLAAAWNPSPNQKQRAENERIEAELDRLITLHTAGQAYPSITTTLVLGRLLRRAARAWRSEAKRGSGKIDLSDSRANMLLAAVRFLGQNGTPEDAAILNEIARLPLTYTGETPPNRDAVRETAAFLVSEWRQRQAENAVPLLTLGSAGQGGGRRP